MGEDDMSEDEQPRQIKKYEPVTTAEEHDDDIVDEDNIESNIDKNRD